MFFATAFLSPVDAASYIASDKARRAMRREMRRAALLFVARWFAAGFVFGGGVAVVGILRGVI